MKKLTISHHALSVLLVWLLIATGTQAQRRFLASVAPTDDSYMELAASDSTALFLPESSALALTFKTNLRPTVATSDKWFAASLTGNRLRVQVEANSGEGVRTGVVSVVGKDGHSAAVEVKQLGTAPAVITKEKRIRLKDNAATFSVDLKANAEFTTELPDWIKLSGKSTVVGAERYTFTATRLDERGEREGVLRFVPEGGEPTTLPVWQNYVGDPRFAVISDLHFGNDEGEGPMVKVPQALRHLLSKPGLDALFICGDLTDGGEATQYEQLRQVFSDPDIVPQDLPVYFLTGDHDNYDPDGQAHFATLGQPLYDFIDIKGYPFIKLGMKGDRGYDGYSDEDRAFLEESLERAARNYPDRPIFVFTHVPAYGTVYGSCPGEGGWGTQLLTDILEKYPQVVIFSGHSHFPLGDPRSIAQGDFTSINLGSTTYSELEPDVVDEGIHPDRYAYVTEGVIVTADRASNLTVERWDTYNDEEILPRWTIAAPHDGTQFTYADHDGGKAPWFDADATITVSDITENGCTVTFPQAQDDEVVHHYVVEVVDANGKVVNSNRRFSGFYLNSHQPQSISVDFSGVPSGSELTARVRGIDSYDNASEPLTSAPFRTSTYEPDPSVTAPEAALFDLVWADDGTATDVSPLANPVIKGSKTPDMEYDEARNRTYPHFDGDGTKFYRIDYASQPAMKTAFLNGFTFEAVYTPDNTSNMCVVSGQQAGCAGIEQGSGGTIQFFANVGGNQYILSSTVTAVPGQTYHVVATYDAAAGQTCIYVNGQPAGTLSTPGEMTFPSDEDTHWVAIGGDTSNSDEHVDYPLSGSIAVARMYDKAVSRDEAYRMYERECVDE